MKNIKVTLIINPLRRNCNFTGSGNIALRGLVKFDPTVAYHFCLVLPATFSLSSRSITRSWTFKVRLLNFKAYYTH